MRPERPEWIIWRARQLRLPFLLFCIGGSMYGLKIGRPILQDGTPHFPYSEVYPFPYPLSKTLFQLLVTCLVIHLTYNILERLIIPLTSGRLENRELIPLTLLYEAKEPDLDGERQTPAPDDTQEITSSIFSKPLTTLPLAISMTAAFVFENYLLQHAPVELYLISHSWTLQLQLLVSYTVSTLDSNSNSKLEGRGLFPSLLLSLCTWFATTRNEVPYSRDLIWMAVTSGILAAVWPLQIQYNNFDVQYQRMPVEDHLLSEPANGSLESAGKSGRNDVWDWLSYTSILAVIFLLPAVLVSSELPHMWHNCFFLNDVRFLVYSTLDAAFRCVYFICIIVFVRAASPLSGTFFMVLVSASQVAFLTYSKPDSIQLSCLGGCGVAALWFCWNTARAAVESRREGNRNSRTCRRMFRVNMPNYVALAMILIPLVFLGLMYFSWHVDYRQQAKAAPHYDVLVPDILSGNDAYLGNRLPVDTVADLDLLIRECRGSYEGLERMRDVSECLKYLATQQEVYFKRLNDTHAKREYDIDSDKNLEYDHQKCEGRIIPYHVWWTGPPNWRVELFIKSYLYTQNLICSQLWIWLNADKDENAMENWLQDAHFIRFLPLMEQQYITLKEWRLPSRVPLSGDIDPLDLTRYYPYNDKPSAYGGIIVAESIIRDFSGQEWVQFYQGNDRTPLTYYTVASSDAARLIILHLYGGIYIDLDVILLRDLRPLILPNHAFAERWGGHPDPARYNNALVTLPANSSLSSYLLRAGMRMGLSYHFNVLGRMLVAEGRDDNDREETQGMGLLKLETALFDPIWPEIDGFRTGKCPVPCLKSFGDVFKAAPVEGEWQSFESNALPSLNDGEEGGGLDSYSNRTLENFYRGAFAYHAHNQWHEKYESGSWIDVICRAHDAFFNGVRTNAYGERWTGPTIERYG